ncbi:Lachesin [Lepeophtheirus salmonis]|uniref:Lachesin n=4 Tax=Lepeophtheirus salmonis TaxID=72036 RepID=A0A7R8CVJ4_LEPSM|nr:Lachesin [Lepeophtheirus salmonis]CAF2945320.1 Lachesin [Lepeophtheirus salmonis]
MYLPKVLFLFFHLLHPNEAQQRRPTISYITQPEIVTDIGGDARMKCSIHYAQEYPVIWIKLDDVDRNNDLIITTSQTMVLNDPRFSINLDKNSSTYTLGINDIQETDAAVYQCQVIISLVDKEVAEVPLIVRRPPIISDNSTRSVVVLAGQKVELRCYASGYPPPTIYWRRQDNAILPTNTSVFKGNILQFDHVRNDHRGTYYCVATNVVGTGARRNVYVEVEFAPEITIPRKRLGQALQFDAELVCSIDAYPAPAIEWFKNRKKLQNSQHYTISHYPNSDIITLTRLTVLTIEKKQYSNYTCRATNTLGESSGTVELFETVVPICPPACGEYTYNSHAVKINFQSKFIYLISASLLRTFLY